MLIPNFMTFKPAGRDTQSVELAQTFNQWVVERMEFEG